MTPASGEWFLGHASALDRAYADAHRQVISRKEKEMKQDLDNTKIRKEVWEKNGYWYAKVISDYEEEGNLADGGYFYKREQSEKMRAFPNEEKAQRWADDSVEAKQLALTSGRDSR